MATVRRNPIAAFYRALSPLGRWPRWLLIGILLYQEKARVPLPSGMGMNGLLPLPSGKHSCYTHDVRTGDEPVCGGLRASALCTTECSRRCREQAVPA
jgi:hypothetical protein